MSGAFSGDEASSGIAADAFSQKGRGAGSLLRVIRSLPRGDRLSPSRPAALTPIWIQPDGHGASGEPYVTIACPECLRTFPQALGSSVSQVREVDCIYCLSRIHYAIVQPLDRAAVPVLQRNRAQEMPESIGQPQFNY